MARPAFDEDAENEEIFDYLCDDSDEPDIVGYTGPVG